MTARLTPRTRLAPATAPALALLGLLASAVIVRGHAALERSQPADGATVPPPTEVIAVFDEPIDPARSRLDLRGPEGSAIAAGGVDPADPDSVTMRLDPPALPAGSYEVRWTAVTPDDGALERGRFGFSVAAGPSGPTASASGSPSGTSSAAPSAVSSASPSTSPTGGASATASATLAGSGAATGPAGTPDASSATASAQPTPVPGAAVPIDPAQIAVPVSVAAVVAVALSYVMLRRRQP